MKIGVIYARYSSDKQTEQSIEGQVRVCKEYAKNNNIVIANAYIDRAMSGRYDNRDAFQQMVKDSKEKLWNCVLVYKFDRFSRNKYETEVYKHKLKENGVELLSAMERIPEGPEGILLESLIIGMNQYYSEELAQKTTRGLKEARIKGRFLGRQEPFGYISNNRVLEINENEAEIVKIIFQEYANGLTTGEIATKLNNMGLHQRENIFHNWSVKRILHKKYYTGVIEDQNEIYDNIYPKIIETDLFDIVQKKLKVNSVGKHVKNIHYTLKHKLFCGVCNQEYVSHAGSGDNRNLIRYYRCKSNKNKQKCSAQTVKKEVIEGFIDKVILKIFRNSNLDFLIEQILKLQNEKFTDKNTLSILENDLKKITKGIDNIVTAIEQGLYSEKTQKRLRELEEQETLTKSKIQSLKSSQKSNMLQKEDILKFINFGLTQCPQVMIDVLVKKIIIYKDKIDIYINYSKINKTEKEYKKITSFSEAIDFKVNHGRNRFVKKTFERAVNIFI